MYPNASIRCKHAHQAMGCGSGVPNFKASATHVMNIAYVMVIVLAGDIGLPHELLIAWTASLILTQLWQLFRGGPLYVSWDEKVVVVAGALLISGLLVDTLDGVDFAIVTGLQSARSPVQAL